MDQASFENLRRLVSGVKDSMPLPVFPVSQIQSDVSKISILSANTLSGLINLFEECNDVDNQTVIKNPFGSVMEVPDDDCNLSFGLK